MVNRSGGDKQRSPSSYRTIFRTSGIIGGAQLIVMLMRLVRAKALALLIGPGGTGIVGLFGSSVGIVAVLTGFGVRGAGIRQIAAVAGSGDHQELARTVRAMRIAVLMTSILGGLVMVGFRIPLSQLAFGDDSYASGMAIMGIVVFLQGIANGQQSLLQALRRVGDLARSRVWGATFGVLTSIFLLGFMGEAGILPFLVFGAIAGVSISWWYVRKVPISTVKLGIGEAWPLIVPLFKLGIGFALGGLSTAGIAYFTRVLVSREFGTVGVGLYGMAWSLSGLLVGFVLQAMGTDFFPRLSAVSGSNRDMRELVNEQTEVGILLVLPGVLGMLALSDLLIPIFYSSEFLPAAKLFRWLLLGMAIRVVSWPLGYVTIAKGRGGLFSMTQIAFATIYLGLLVYAIPLFGLNGVGVAFFFTYVFHLALTFSIARHLCGFSWSQGAIQIVSIGGGLTFSVFALFYIAPKPWPHVIGFLVTLIAAFMAFYRLKTLLKVDPVEFLKNKMSR